MGYLPDKPAVIYAIRCNKTGRVYIGSTVNLQSRLQTHFRELKSRDKRAALFGPDGRSGDVTPAGSVWQKDYDEYGRDAFEVYILEENVPRDKRDERETYWMVKYKSLYPKYGYNLHPDVKVKYPIHPGLPPLPPEEKPSE